MQQDRAGVPDIEDIGKQLTKHLQKFVPGTWVFTTVNIRQRSSGCGRQCPVLCGVLEQYLPERGRWALRLTNGQSCAVKVDQIVKAPFQPFDRAFPYVKCLCAVPHRPRSQLCSHAWLVPRRVSGVEVTDTSIPWLQMCGELTAFHPGRMRWTITLDIGHSLLVAADQVRITSRPMTKDLLRPLQRLAWAKSLISKRIVESDDGSPAFVLSPDLVEAIASIATSEKAPLPVWARFLEACR